MWPFSKSRTHSFETALILDIGSASVGGALVVRVPEQPPRIIYHARRSIPFEMPLNPDRLTRDMLIAARHVVDDINSRGFARLNPNLKNRNHAVDAALVGYTSPWFDTSVLTHTLRYEKPHTIQRGDVDALIREKEAELVLDPNEKIIERAVTALTLDGYVVHGLSGKQAKSLSVTTVTTAIPHDIKRSLEDILLGGAHPRTIIHHSFPLMATTVVRNIFPHAPSFLYLDITGEVTDCLYVKQGMVVAAGSFPIGVHTVLRRVAASFGASVDHVDSLISANKDKTLHELDASKLDLVLDQERARWRDELESTLEKMHIPGLTKHVVYTVDQEALPIFGTIFEGSDASQGSMHLYGALLKDHVTFPERAITDPFLALEAIFLQTYS